jgi:Uma2 family endonuclease
MSATLTPNAKTLQITPVEFHEMPPDRRVRFTVEQYEQLMRAGFLIEGSPIELLDGQLIWKDRRDHRSPGMSVGKWHAQIIRLLVVWLTKVCEGHECFSMSQLPLSLTPINEPEPDLCVIIGSPEDEFPRHPEPSDILLVIEVADSSLSYDLGEKLRLYASVGIPVYWVIDLINEVIVVLEDPDAGASDYRQRTVFHKGESVSLTLADGTAATTPVEALLP